MVLAHIESRHEAEGFSYRTLCEREGVAYASLMRWKDRAARGEALVERPGPKKVAPLDLEALRAELRVLRHGRRRTEGTGEIYRQHQEQISRRDLGQLVVEERRQKNRERNRVYHEVNWKIPRLVWAMDDTEYHPDPAYPKAYLNNVQDLGSRYKFEPRVGLLPGDPGQQSVPLPAVQRRHRGGKPGDQGAPRPTAFAALGVPGHPGGAGHPDAQPPHAPLPRASLPVPGVHRRPRLQPHVPSQKTEGGVRMD